MNINIIGGGGHAKVVIDTLYNSKYTQPYPPIINVFDDRYQELKEVLDCPVVGEVTKFLDQNPREFFFVAMGDNRLRMSLLRAGWKHKLYSPRIIHNKAIVSDYATIGAGSIIMAGAIVQPGAKIGKGCIVNTGATVDHDCVLENGVHICPGAHLAGGVTIGAGTQVGTGASIIPGISIGENCQIGAGAVVTKDCLRTGSVLIGVPARRK